MTKKKFTVTLTFTEVEAENQEAAALQIFSDIRNCNIYPAFDVTDEDTGEKFVVDTDLVYGNQ